MILLLPASRNHIGGRRAFTMMEIVLCIAIMAFALVAILGVLPTGMTVQRQNAEDTVMNQEGQYWIEALRSGVRGLEELTNHIEEITVANDLYSVSYSNFNDANAPKYVAPSNLVGLLMQPLVESIGSSNRLVTNRVTVRIRAITGSASSKGTLASDSDFRYQMRLERSTPFTVPVETAQFEATFEERNAQTNFVSALDANLQELRLVFRWPLFERAGGWVPGQGRKTYRALIAAHMDIQTNSIASQPAYLWFPDGNEFFNPYATDAGEHIR